MKVEAGESLILSWLRHVIGCQIVQLNWKPSVDRWTLHDGTMLDAFVAEAEAHFRDRRGLAIFNQGDPSQLIRQGEIDVLGLRRDEDGLRLYAVDVANHFSGLNLGTRERTVARVLKKLVRSAVSVHGFFPGIPAEVLFASPKVDHQTRSLVMECLSDINESLERRSLPITARLVCNEEFGTEIIQKVIDCAGSVADTSELFLRTIQLCQIAGATPGQRRQARGADAKSMAGAGDAAGAALGGIGIHVQQQLQRLIDRGLLSREEIIMLQDQQYSSATFGQSYPVLKRHDPSLPRSERQHRVNGHGRYYADPIRIGDQHYYLCSQWVDRHRGAFDRWVTAHMGGA